MNGTQTSAAAKENVQAPANRVFKTSTPTAARSGGAVQLRSRHERANKPRTESPTRRCKSEVTSPNTAELLAKFVASRASNRLNSEGESVVPDQQKQSHFDKDKDASTATRAIMSVDKDGIIAVNQVSCTVLQFVPACTLKRLFEYVI